MPAWSSGRNAKCFGSALRDETENLTKAWLASRACHRAILSPWGEGITLDSDGMGLWEGRADGCARRVNEAVLEEDEALKEERRDVKLQEKNNSDQKLGRAFGERGAGWTIRKKNKLRNLSCMRIIYISISAYGLTVLLVSRHWSCSSNLSADRVWLPPQLWLILLFV